MKLKKEHCNDNKHRVISDGNTQHQLHLNFVYKRTVIHVYLSSDMDTQYSYDFLKDMRRNTINLFQIMPFPLPFLQPDSSSWLLKEGVNALQHLGAHLPLKGVLGEAWVLAAYTPGTFLYESLISCKNSSVMDSSPLAFSISLPRRPGYTGCIHCPHVVLMYIHLIQYTDGKFGQKKE